MPGPYKNGVPLKCEARLGGLYGAATETGLRQTPGDM
jgi:hypothetical protein